MRSDGVPLAPTVSVVIPAFNAEAEIEDAIRSALDQSLAPLEVIVIDDASRDRTASILERLGRVEPRLRVISARANRGPAWARNQGLAVAAGDWIAPLDSDDRFLPDRLSVLTRRAEALGADLVADDLLIDGRQGARPMFGWLRESRLTAAGFLRGNLPDPADPARSHGFLKPIVRRRFLAEQGLRYDSSMRFAEDFGLYLACLLAGGRFHLYPKALYRYRTRAGSLTARHSVADLRRLLDHDRRVEARFGGEADVALRRALRQHRRSIERRLSWRVFIESVKARDWPQALAAWVSSPPVCWHVSAELLREVVRRAGRGVSWRARRRAHRAAAE